jgi:hypothetical protein
MKKRHAVDSLREALPAPPEVDHKTVVIAESTQAFLSGMERIQPDLRTLN